ncbi:hypothetical protein B566_EDAN012041 [Ephemera danica]|nr:hypothetical protein B566_EDAN012041 [Ephemera danica]
MSRGAEMRDDMHLMEVNDAEYELRPPRTPINRSYVVTPPIATLKAALLDIGNPEVEQRPRLNLLRNPSENLYPQSTESKPHQETVNPTQVNAEEPEVELRPRLPPRNMFENKQRNDLSEDAEIELRAPPLPDYNKKPRPMLSLHVESDLSRSHVDEPTIEFRSPKTLEMKYKPMPPVRKDVVNSTDPRSKSPPARTHQVPTPRSKKQKSKATMPPKPIPWPQPPVVTPKAQQNETDSMDLSFSLMDAVENGDLATLEVLLRSTTQTSTSKQELVNEQHGRTALHLACSAGSDTCVLALLEAGANVNSQIQPQIRAESPRPQDKNPWSSEKKHTQRKLLQVPTKKQPTIRDVTPNPETIKFCSVGNQLPLPECWGRTPLHQAVKAGQPACVRLLLMAKALVDVRDEKGLTPLLLAGAGVSLEDDDGVERLLVQRGADVCKRGANGETPLHEAAHCGADQLVNKPDHVGCTPLHKAAYSGARESLALLLRHGGDLAATTHSKTSVLDAIFTYVARPSQFLASVLDACVQTNNASVLDRAFKVYIDFTVLSPHGQHNQTAVMRGILSTPTGPQHNKLLQHPILETFLRLKWQRLRFFFFTLLFIYVCFLLSFSVHVTLVHTKESPQLARDISRYFLCGTSSLLLVHTLLQDQQEHKWEPHVTSVTMLLAWTELMLLVGRFPRWGNYALMFYTVLQNVLRVLLAFVCIVVGFALSFFVQFGKNGSSPLFGNPWRAFVKTMVMMTGEYEYKELFESNSTDFAGNNSTDFAGNNSTGSGDVEYLYGTSRLIFLIFVVLASIVMVNLMVGLAVSDIQGIQVAGHFRRLLKQAEFVDHLEFLISHKLFSKLLPNCVLSLLSRRRSIVTTLTIQPSSTERKHRRPHHLPHRLLEACVELAVRRRVMSAISSKNSEEFSWSDSIPRDPVADRVDQSSNTSLDPLSVDELLHRISSDLRVVKQMLFAREPSPSSARNSPPRASSPARLKVPRTSRRYSRRSSRFVDVTSEVQGAQVMLHRMGSTSRSDPWTRPSI